MRPVAGAALLALAVTAGCTSDPVATSSPPTTTTTTWARPTLPTSTVPVAPQVRADLDGDGRPDTLTARPANRDDSDWTLVADLASGGRTTLNLVASRLVPVLIPVHLGAGPAEQVFVTKGGNTWEIGTVVLVDHGNLRVATMDGDGDALFGWYNHSGSSPLGTNDVVCEDGRILQSSSEYTPSFDARTGRRWGLTAYRLDGTRLVVVEHREGTLALDEPPPADVPLDNRLSCGGTAL